MASEFTEKSVKEFLIANGGRVKNTDLVTYFKRFLNDPSRKDEMREKFKNYVNTLATIKMDDNKEKILMLKKKYREDSGGGNWDGRAQSEPPSFPPMPGDRPDGAGPSRVKSDGNLSSTDIRLSSATLESTTDTASLGSGLSSSSSRSLSSVGQEEDNNASVLSVKERAKHLNRIESESEIQKVSSSSLGAVRKKDHRKVRDPDGDDSSTDSYSPLSALEKEWLVKCSSSEYHLMNELLSKNPHLASVKEFTSTALHWAAKKGKPEVIKMLLSRPGVYVNQRTGYTPLHLAAIQGHEGIIELLTKTYYADANIRDYSGKKAKQYLSNSASSRAQRDSLVLIRSKSVPFDKSDNVDKTDVMSLDKHKELLVSSRLSSKSGNEKSDNGFMRNSGSRRSNRESAIKSLIRASTGAMKQTVMRSGWGSSEDVINERTPKSSPRNSAEPSPVIHRRKGSFKDRDRDLMPPPGASSRHSHKSNKPQHSVSKESLHTEDKKLSMMKQVPRSESEPNLGEIVQPSRSTFI